MGILDKLSNSKEYYYFHTFNGKTEIVKTVTALNMLLFSKLGYEEMTQEQIDYYISHPEASIDEIRNCCDVDTQTDQEEEYEQQDEQITTDKFYYYFYTKNGVTTIVKKFFALNMNLYGYKEGKRIYYELLTDEQESFYLNNPEASVNEVRNCMLNEPPTPQTQSIIQIREYYKNKLKEAYYAKMSEYSDLDVVGAISSHYANTTLSISNVTPYTASEAKNIIEGFNSLMKSAKAVYELHKTSIESATTEEDIDNEFELAKREMEAL